MLYLIVSTERAIIRSSNRGSTVSIRTPKRHFYLAILLILIYLGLALIPSPDPAAIARYHLTATTLRIIDAAILLPFAGIWMVAIYGYHRFMKYALLIKDSKDGVQILTMAQGLRYLAYGLPVAGIVSQVLTQFALHHSISLPAAKIITNYFNLILPLIAFIIISRGARGLADLRKLRPTLRGVHALTILSVIIGVSYCYSILSNNYSVAMHSSISTSAYFLPGWLVLLTLAGPYLYMWFIGLLSAAELYLYHKTLKGVIYRRSWALVSGGLTGVIISSILLQYITTLTPKLVRLRLNTLLILIYILLISIAAGYILIAVGAKRLQKIEEV
jgi:hypothetical protein